MASIRQKHLIIFTAVLLFTLAIVLPKPYAFSGGFMGMGKTRECGCLGFEYSYYPQGITDAMKTYYCAGIPYECTEAHAFDFGFSELVTPLLMPWGVIALITSLLLWATSKRLGFRDRDYVTALCISVLGCALVLTSSAFSLFLEPELSYRPVLFIVTLLAYAGFSLRTFLMNSYVVLFHLLLIRICYREGWRNTLKATVVVFFVWFLAPILFTRFWLYS